MKYTGPRLTALIAAGIITFNSHVFKPGPITGYKTPEEGSPTEYAQNVPSSSTSTKIDTFGEKDNEEEQTNLFFGQFKQKLEDQFKSLTVTLDGDADKYVSSIYIDGVNVRIVLKDGSEVSGKLEYFNFDNLNLDNFYVFDYKFRKRLRES